MRADRKCNNEINHVVALPRQIFADNVSGVMTLSTIHRSKGRNLSVYWLDRFNTCPSRYRAKIGKNSRNNLCYVAATRAMEELIDLFLRSQGTTGNEKQQTARLPDLFYVYTFRLMTAPFPSTWEGYVGSCHRSSRICQRPTSRSRFHREVKSMLDAGMSPA